MSNDVLKLAARLAHEAVAKALADRKEQFADEAMDLQILANRLDHLEGKQSK
jgi:hypothetical protein